MFRLSVVFALVIVTGAAGAPVPREGLRPPVPIAGSVWEGEGVDGPTIYVFHENGRMSTTYTDKTGQVIRGPDIGSWKQDGTEFYWETCNKYCEFDGKVAGTTIAGKAHNKPGGKWTLTFKRKGSEEK